MRVLNGIGLAVAVLLAYQTVGAGTRCCTAGICETHHVGAPTAAYGHHGAVLLPDPVATPGEARTTDQNDPAVCGGAGTTAVRNVPESLKREVFAEYGVDRKKVLPGDPPASEQDAWYHDHKTGERTKKRPLFEIDHLVSLELGGANSKKNLMPQPYYQHPGAHEKDALENWLHAQICGGKMTLPEAQREISQDWYEAYLRMKGPNARK